MPRLVVSDHNRQDWASPNNPGKSGQRPPAPGTVRTLLLYIYYTYLIPVPSNLQYRLISAILESRKDREEVEEAQRRRSRRRLVQTTQSQRRYVTAAHITYTPQTCTTAQPGSGGTSPFGFLFSCSYDGPSRGRWAVGHHFHHFHLWHFWHLWHLLHLLHNRGPPFELLLPGCGFGFPSTSARRTLGGCSMHVLYY